MDISLIKADAKEMLIPYKIICPDGDGHGIDSNDFRIGVLLHQANINQISYHSPMYGLFLAGECLRMADWLTPQSDSLVASLNGAHDEYMENSGAHNYHRAVSSITRSPGFPTLLVYWRFIFLEKLLQQYVLQITNPKAIAILPAKCIDSLNSALTQPMASSGVDQATLRINRLQSKIRQQKARMTSGQNDLVLQIKEECS